jgi:hypothetical protein
VAVHGDQISKGELNRMHRINMIVIALPTNILFILSILFE